jgi:hypothetical protein
MMMPNASNHVVALDPKVTRPMMQRMTPTSAIIFELKMFSPHQFMLFSPTIGGALAISTLNPI